MPKLRERRNWPLTQTPDAPLSWIRIKYTVYDYAQTWNDCSILSQKQQLTGNKSEGGDNFRDFIIFFQFYGTLINIVHYH